MSAQGIYRFLPWVNTEASFLVFLFAMLISTVGSMGGAGVFFFGLDITEMAYISFWVFDFCIWGMLLVPWMPLPALKNHSNQDRLRYMINIWIWVYVVVAYVYEVPWVFGYDEIAYAESELWAYQWWSYIHGGDIRYLYVELDVLFAEVWACTNAVIASFGLYHWHKSGRTSVGAVYTFMFCAGMHIAPTVQYYSLEAFHGFPNVDVGNPSNFIAKFILSNSPWLIMPFIVFYWGTRELPYLYGVVEYKKPNEA